jgi:hypothetical protein
MGAGLTTLPSIVLPVVPMRPHALGNVYRRAVERKFVVLLVDQTALHDCQSKAPQGLETRMTWQLCNILLASI